MLEPSSLKKDHDLGIEQYWKIHDRLSNKEGFHHNIYWITGDQYRGYWKHNKKDGNTPYTTTVDIIHHNSITYVGLVVFNT